MARENTSNRREALLVAGATGLAVLGLQPSSAQASKHPRIDAAIQEMIAAKDYLQKAPNNFGGHKHKAIEALSAAISQLEMALQH